MLSLLYENIFPSITTSLQEMGMEYCHITIAPEFSMAFFNHMKIEFPFERDDLINENGNLSVVFSIRHDGQLSLSSNFDVINGVVRLRNNIVFSEDILEFFKVNYENVFLFNISGQLSERAAQFVKERNVLYELLDKMANIRPLLKRNILIEKLKKNY